MKKLFELQQKITFLGNEYRIIKEGKLVAYARQKRFALREQFKLFANESQTTILATSKARSVIDLGATFDVWDSEGKTLAILKKNFKKSLFSSSWSVYDSKMDKELYHVTEKSQGVAIARRLWELVPFIDFIPFPFKFHFLIMHEGKIAGEYMKLTYIRDHYAMFLKEDHHKKLDERVWMVMAVLLDAMQSR